MKKEKKVKVNKITKAMKKQSLIFSFVTQAQDDDLFREMLDHINFLNKYKYSKDNFEQIVRLTNDILGYEELLFEYKDKNYSIFKNSRGMVIKVINKKGKMFIDSYYSYSSVRSVGSKKIKLGDLLFFSAFKKIYNLTSNLIVLKTTPEILRHIIEYVIKNKLIDSKIVLTEILNDKIPVEVEEKLSYSIMNNKQNIKFEECFEYMSDNTVLNLIKKIPEMNNIIEKKQVEKKKILNLKIFQFISIAISMVIGISITHGVLAVLNGISELSFISLFISMTLGIIINNTTGDYVLKNILKDYEKRLKLGESSNGVEIFVMANLFNVILHITLLFIMGVTLVNIYKILVSTIFFIYPVNYLMSIMWSVKEEVTKINKKEEKINRRYYANIPNETVKKEEYLSVTISIPVYLEENEVIFETLRQSKEAIENFKNKIGKPANIVVSDDGIQKMLDGKCSVKKIKELIKLRNEDIDKLTSLELQAIERIEFFKKNKIAFVARSVDGRAGRFKKGSNLNYSLKLANKIKKGTDVKKVFGKNGEFEGGYAEGNITFNEIILLLDKDSGLNPNILTKTIPEFVVDPKLVYTQHSTRATNSSDNYFTKAMGQFTRNLFANSLPNKALQGFLVPLVGHNAFLRKSFIENSGYWAENRVSEDFSKAIDAYRFGYHGKYIAYDDLDFTEYVSRTYTEETGKQLRYSFGIVEILFNGTSDWLKLGLFNNLYKRQLKMYPRARFYDIFDMLTYFCSFLNSAALIPTAIIAAYTGRVDHIWGGFISNLIIFTLMPIISKAMIVSKKEDDLKGTFFNSMIIGLAFLGHTYSVLKGFIKFFTDSFKEKPKPFEATSVDSLDYSFCDGVRIVCNYYKNNKIFILITILFIERVINLLTNKTDSIMTMITMTYILLMFPLVLPLLTPPLYTAPRKLKKLKALIEFTKRDKEYKH